MAMEPLKAMRGATSRLLLCLISVLAIRTYGSPVVVNTWPFVDATSEAWRSLLESADSDSAALNAVEQVHFSCPDSEASTSEPTLWAVMGTVSL